MGTYGGHLWYEFQHAAPLLSELPPFLCVFENTPNLLIDGHNGLAGAQ